MLHDEPLGWEAPDVGATMNAFNDKGVTFERFGLPGQDKHGVSTAPGGAKVAWFRGPDGNLLSLSSGS